MTGIPVTISDRGSPFVSVESGAPLATVAENGLGLPIRVVEKGAPPLIIEGYNVWSPADLFADGEQGGWYDPSDLSTMFQDVAGTIPSLPGDPVGLVLDKSGNSRNLSQPTAAARPTLMEQDGVYWLQGDGADDFLQSPTVSGWEATGSSLACAMQSDISEGSDARIAFGVLSGGVSNFTLRLRPNQPFTSHQVQFRAASVSAAALNNILNKTNPFTLVGVSDGDLKAYLEGELVSMATTQPSGSFDGLIQIGDPALTWRFYGGLMIQRALTEAEIQAVSAYLAGKMPS